jgi:hypothetical protein
MAETASAALTPKGSGSFGPGTDEMKTLLDKHEDAWMRMVSGWRLAHWSEIVSRPPEASCDTSYFENILKAVREHIRDTSTLRCLLSLARRSNGVSIFSAGI